MKRIRLLLRRAVYSLTLSMIVWVTCSLPLDKTSSTLTAVCRVSSWPIRMFLKAASAIGVRNDPLAFAWCDFCSAEERLYRSLLTGIVIYLMLLYVPDLVRSVWRRLRRVERGK
jgi:hypothetical protein